MASWIYRRGGTPEEIHARYGLRLLTWGDRLLWLRFAEGAGVAGVWIVLVLWLLSRLYEIGPLTVAVVTWIGLFAGFVTMAGDRFERDLRLWPRRTDPEPRPLARCDRVSWVWVGEMLAGTTLVIALVLWLPSKLYELGPVIVIVVGWLGIFGVAVGVLEEPFEKELRR